MAATGSDVLAAFKKASTWGTAVSVGANDGILLLREGITKRQDTMVDASAGQAFYREADRGNIDVRGALPCAARYDGLTTLLAMVMGTAGAPAQQGGTTAYLHTLELADNTDGKFGTYAIDKKTQIQEVPSLKIVGFTLRGQAGQVCELEFDTMGDDLLKPAVTNTSLASVTYRDRANRILFSRGVFRIADQGGAALGSGDVVKPASFEFRFRWNLKGEYLAGSANKVDEPVNDGFPECSLQLQFPIFCSTAWAAALQGDTRKKADITFTGGLIADTYYYALTIELPHLCIRGTSDHVGGPGKIPNPVTFDAYEAVSAPTGMTVTKPFQLKLMNKQSTDPLA